MYVKLHKKVRIDKNTYKSPEEPEIRNHILRGGQIGWIVEEGYVVIDIDTPAEAKALYEIVTRKGVKCGVHSTKKGMHFIFRTNKVVNQGVGLHTPIGLSVDTRCAGKGYIVLPVNDPDREFLIERPFSDLDNLPYWLSPLAINTSNDKFVKVGSGEGDGRNDALLKQVFRLKHALLKPDQIKTTVLLINEFVFKDPISFDELQSTVLREEVLNLKLVLEENKFSHLVMAQNILGMNDESGNGYKIKFVSDQFYLYSNGVYREAYQQLLKIMLEMYPQIKDAQRKEVLKYLEIVTYEKDFHVHEKYINLRNGLFNLETKELQPHTEQFAGRNQLSFNYSVNRVVPEVDRFIDNICNHNPERQKMLLQWLGYMLTNSNREQKLLFMYGASASNGKSTFLEVVGELVGDDNMSTVSLEQLAKSPFSLPELDGKVINLQADITPEYLKDLSVIKNIVTGDVQSVARKFGQPFKLRPYCKLIYSMNEIPKAPKDEGWFRRIHIIPFEKQFDGSEFFNKGAIMHPDALDYLGSLALDHYTELFQLPESNSKWANYAETASLLQNYKEEVDNALYFLKNHAFYKDDFIFKGDEILISKSNLYSTYHHFCSNEDGLKPKSKPSFGKTIKDSFGEKVYNNKHWWIVDITKISYIEQKDPEAEKLLKLNEVLNGSKT